MLGLVGWKGASEGVLPIPGSTGVWHEIPPGSSATQSSCCVHSFLQHIGGNPLVIVGCVIFVLQAPQPLAYWVCEEQNSGVAVRATAS